METKEIKVQAPKGYEIDKENSTFECIRFKPIKKDITYEDVCNKLFERNAGYSINPYGKIDNFCLASHRFDVNNASNKKQLERVLALNQLLNIAEYYNKNVKNPDGIYTIGYGKATNQYEAVFIGHNYKTSLHVLFHHRKDAQAVIDNPNFREILDTIYKD